MDAKKSSTTSGLLIHGAGAEPENWLPGVLRSAANAAVSLPEGTLIEVVIQGPAVKLLKQESSYGEDIAAVLKTKAAVVACQNSMRSAEVTAEQLLPGVGAVPAAIAHLAERQWQGWAYVRL